MIDSLHISTTATEPSTTPIEPVVEAPKDEFASNFEKIAKQEKHNSDIRKQLEDKRKAFETDKSELEKYRQFDKELKLNPLGVLEKLGLSLPRIQQLAQERNQPQNPEARRAIELAERLERELKERDEKDKNDRLSREEIRLNASIAEVVKNDQYDIIEHLGLEGSVKEYMEQYYEETGEIIEIKKACDAVANAIALKVARIKDSRFLNNSPKEESKEIKQESPKTLNNKMVQSSEKVVKGQSESDRMKEAIRLLSK